MSKARYHGAFHRMGPVPVATGASFTKDDILAMAAGEVALAGAGAAAGLCVSLAPWPDNDYVGTRTRVDVGRLGEDTEVELDFVAGAGGIVAGDIGKLRPLNANRDIDLAALAGAGDVFQILRLGGDTAYGDTTGTVIGVFTDGASL